MKRIVCLITLLLVCFAMIFPAFAAEDTFVPSIGYKDGPEIEDAELEEEDVGDCLIVTSIMEAEEKSTDIYQEDRDLLLEVYDQLSDGSMTLPLEGEYVIRELVDVSFKKTTCIEKEHGHKEALAEDGTTIRVDFDLGIEPGVKVVVMTYIDGQWVPVESVVNNGDGTLTCVFADICPVVFCVERELPSQTGDSVGQSTLLWMILMIVSLAAIVTLTVNRRRFMQ